MINNAAKNKPSTQQYLDIAEIHDGVVILKDGSLRAVLMVSSINFSLKEEREKDAIIYSFQSFLNYLNFDIQILIRSRRLDLKDYIKKMTEMASKQKNTLLKAQTQGYIAFIDSLLEVANIMDKKFFVVVPFYTAVAQTASGLMNKMNKSMKPENSATEIKLKDFEGNRLQLIQRVEVVASQLSNMGLRCVSLDTQELIELFYTSYNPDTAHYQKLTDIEMITNKVIHGANLPGDKQDTVLLEI